MFFDFHHESMNINELAPDWIGGEGFLGQNLVEPMVVLD